jgi:hypothetical protein
MPVPGLLHRAQGGLPTRAVQDTIAAVFRERVYDRATIRTLWDRFWEAVWDGFHSLFDTLGHSPMVARIIEYSLAAIVVAVVARAVMLGYLGERAWTWRGADRHRTGARGDSWATAQRLAAAGHYTEAAHALYAALLEGIASREQVRLHPSKTVGDYARDLRRRSSSLLAPFRDFARSYEIVIYGLRACDRERYERLYAIAARMVAPRP